MIETTGNRRYALWFSVLSLATSLLALSLMTLFFTTDASFSPSVLISPVVLILAFAPLIGILGIILKNKEVLIFSSVISLALTILGIVSIGFLFVVPSLLLIISTFVYLSDEPVVEAKEKARISAFVIALASLFSTIAATASEVSFGGSMLQMAFGLIFYLFPLIPPILGIIGIRNGNKEFLFSSCAISLVLSIFLELLLRKPLFLASSLLLVISAFVYQDGIIGKFKREIADTKMKNIALVLAGVALVGAMFITLYSEGVLVTDGCYEYQTSLTSGERICSDFRIDYMIPVIISAVGMAGILGENKLLLYASATVAFIRIIVYLQPIASLFLPSFIVLILSALIYKMGIRSVEPQAEGQENAKQYYVLLILFGIVIFWIIAVYIFVHPASIEMSGGYGYTPAKRVP